MSVRSTKSLTCHVVAESAAVGERAREATKPAGPVRAKLQVGSGDRSERIRTYNFPQGRVTITASISRSTSSTMS